MGWFSSTNKSVGLDIGTSFIKAVEMEKSGISNNIISFAKSELKEGIITQGEIKKVDELASILDDFFRKNSLSRDKVVLCLGGNSCSIQIEDFAAKNEKELASSVKFWQNENIGNKNIPFAHQILDKNIDEIGGNIYSVLLVWAEKDIIAPYDLLIDKMGFGEYIIQVDHFGTYNGIDFSSEYGKILLIEGGAYTTNIAVLDGSIIKFLKTVPIGLESIIKEVSQETQITSEEILKTIKENGFLSESQDMAMISLSGKHSELCDLIKRSIKNYLPSETSMTTRRKRKKDGISKVLITGGMAHIPGIDKFFGEKLEISTEFPSLQEVGGKSLPDNSKFAYTTALGLAIQGLG